MTASSVPWMAPARAPVARLVYVAVLVLLAGCANPIVKLDLAGHSLKASPAPKGEPTSMAEAIGKLNHVRAAYSEEIHNQTGATQNSITGLVWLGAVMLGAAPAVHRDALVTAGVIGGTTYGLTVAQLDKRRIDVWQAGIDALDCARAAVVPLEINDSERNQIKTGMETLQLKKTAAETARAKLASNLGTREVTEENDLKIRALLAAADEQIAQTEKTQNAGNFLLRASSGSELSVVVNNISSKVNQVMGDIALPPSAVKEILAGLPGQISMLVPGALPKAATSDGDDKAKAESSSVVDKDIKNLSEALKELEVAQRDLNKLLTNSNGTATAATAATAALKACKLADVIKPFELVPTTLTFTQGRAQVAGFEIKGGLPNYRVKALGTLPEGISMSFEGDSANTVSIAASDKVQPTEARILVSDKSNPAQTQQFVVKVIALPPPPPPPNKPKDTGGKTPVTPPPKPTDPVTTPTPTPAPAATPAPAPSDAAAVEDAWKALQAALAAPGFTRTLSGVTLGVESTQLKSGRLIVKLKCSKPDAGLAAVSVREELAAAAPEAKATLQKNDALDGKLKQIDLSRSKPCVKE